jgi:membrane-associated phospholipid phosphatase
MRLGGTGSAVVSRRDPDATGYSFPPGHASVRFATATVLQRHFGWKGALAYPLAAYVAASRLHENRHHLGGRVAPRAAAC